MTRATLSLGRGPDTDTLTAREILTAGGILALAIAAVALIQRL